MFKLITIVFLSLAFWVSCSKVDFESVDKVGTSANDDGLNQGLGDNNDSGNSGEGTQDTIAKDTTSNDDNDSSGNNDSNDNDLKDDIDTVMQSCKAGQKKTKVVNVAFPQPGKSCDFGMNGNLSPKDKEFRGRIEATASFSLPQDAKVCDLDFQFDEQPFKYDDHFSLNLNDVVMASSYNIEQHLNLLEDMPIYSWDHIKGTKMEFDTNNERVNCYGNAETCQFPGHDQQGVIEIDFAEEDLQKVMATRLGQSNHFFQLVTFGDNDPEVSAGLRDCEHVGMEFSLTIKYVD